MTIYFVRLLIPDKLQNLKGVKKPCHSKEGGVHERHGEDLVCRDVDLRRGSGLNGV